MAVRRRFALAGIDSIEYVIALFLAFLSEWRSCGQHSDSVSEGRCGNS